MIYIYLQVIDTISIELHIDGKIYYPVNICIAVSRSVS